MFSHDNVDPVVVHKQTFATTHPLRHSVFSHMSTDHPLRHSVFSHMCSRPLRHLIQNVPCNACPWCPPCRRRASSSGRRCPPPGAPCRTSRNQGKTSPRGKQREGIPDLHTIKNCVTPTINKYRCMFRPGRMRQKNVI